MTAAPSPHFDVFLSYSWEDHALACRLQVALEAQRLRVFRDERGIQDFQQIDEAIAGNLARSRSLVALYSPAFPESPYCRWELATALAQAHRLDGHTRRVLAVRHGVDFADLVPAQLADVKLPVATVSVEAVAESVATHLSQVDDRVLGDAPSATPGRWLPHEPQPAPAFRGRWAELWRIKAALTPGYTPTRRGRAVAVLLGLGGQGKTALAVEYARRFADEYPGGIFLLHGFGSHLHSRGDHAFALDVRRRQLERITRQLTNGQEADEHALRDHLERAGLPYLWIVDDLPRDTGDELFDALLAPTATGHTLITTRYESAARRGEPIRLSALADEDAVALITSARRPAPGERAAARQLACADLGGHPQALSLAAGLAATDGFAGYAALRAELAAPGPDAIALAAELHGEIAGRRPASIAATLLRSIRDLPAPARETLQLVSVLATAPIAEPLLAEILAAADDAEPAQRSDLVSTGLDLARQRGLAQPVHGDDQPLWLVHALVIRTLRFVDLADARRQRFRRAALEVLTRRLDDTRPGLRYGQIERDLPHLREVVRPEQGVGDRYALNEAGRAYVELGDLPQAEEVFARLASACRTALGDDDPSTLAVLVGLAATMDLRGRHREAIELKVRVHAALVRVLGSDDPDTLTALHNVAVGHLNLREPAAAAKLFRTVYGARRRLLSIHDADTLVSLGDYATAVARAGRPRLAHRLRSAVHERMRRLRGDDDVLTLEALNSLGASQRDAGEVTAAAATFEAVYAGRVRLLGPTHPETLSAAENVAIVTDPARLHAVYAVRVLEHHPADPHVLATLHNLLVATAPGLPVVGRPAPPDVPLAPPPGLQLDPLEDFDANTDFRVAVFTRAHAVHEERVRRLGPDDPETLLALCYVGHASALLGQGGHQLEAALFILTDAAAGLREARGANHPHARLADRLRDWVADQVDG
ncbi:tetratricopeptide repeat protein [Micromonospora thermarum]|uniref:Toll/interleukin-1 receptor domain-containing protein n=1 Tax=Micromonospora thermarum TaxID=2720024 RepID=A0ABX0ZBA5_9ACTN|nr:toll/interleukin-1 receptor domain-containing protein [Micromonospora thermarum]NJP33754.1 toll/interleukin-1 receptor domain-containing protein [Micromonospora thermarum]